MTAHNGMHSADADGEGAAACRWQDSLALHALGALAPLEAKDLTLHLAGPCGTCRDEWARLEASLATLDALELEDAADLPAPGPDVRARLMARLGERPAPGAPAAERSWQHLKALPGIGRGLSTVPAGPEGWERTAFEGIEVKPLFVEPTQRRVTMLVRMAPGSSYPAHRHATSEECFVVSGEIQVGERTLRTGDYQVATGGSEHGVQSTRSGCTLLIVSSQDDEWVA
jgi:anti-sigma factor ChrR (cupin superfamily)